MGKSSLRKDTFREIKNTKGRFMSILLIVAVGVGVFCGIKATEPSMIDSMEKTFNQQALYDYKLLSTVGFDEKDVEAVQKIEEVEKVQAAYSVDVLYQDKDTQKALKVMSIADENDAQINVPVLTEGRMPENENECVVCQTNKLAQSIEIGQEIIFEKEAGQTDVDAVMKHRSYKVTGFVELPQYFSEDFDECTIGDGDIGAVVMIPKSNFTYERFTEIYLTLKCHGEGVSAFSDEYTRITEQVTPKLTEIGEVQYNHFILEKQEAITDAEAELVQKESDAQDQLDAAAAELKSAAEQIDEAEFEIAEGEEKYTQGFEQVQNGLAASRHQLDEGWNTYNASLSEYNISCQIYQTALQEYKDNDAQLDEIKNIYNHLLTIRDELQKQVDQGIDPYTLSDAAWAWLQKTFGWDDETLQAYKSGLKRMTPDEMKNFLSAANEELKIYEEEIAQMQQALDAAKEKLDQTELELRAVKAQLDTALTELEGKEKVYQEAKLAAEDELTRQYSVLETGKASLAQAKSAYNTGTEAYVQAVREAESLIKDGKERILSAKDSLAEVESGKWYIFTRNDTVLNYRYFKGDTERIDAIAAVFPLFFLMVAILVCMSTMSRMVDEQRMQIGTYKALGYKKHEILIKYLVYGTLAGLAGVIIGPVIGMTVIPRVIANGYSVLYRIKDMRISVPWFPVGMACLLGVAGVMLVAFLTCRKAMKEEAAVLMRPKAPKAGSRIMLEKITPLWKKLTFFQKLTIRNIFRYKGRVIMTIIGITGCMSLMLSGFAINDAISPITDREFSEIKHYDAILYFKESRLPDDAKAELDIVREDSRIDAAGLFNLTSVRAMDLDEQNELDYTYICVPEDPAGMDQFISLRTPDTDEALSLNSEGAIVTKRLAEQLNLSIGDQFQIEAEDEKYRISISGITEGYVLNYIYMTPEYYKQVMGKDAEYNQIFAINNENMEDGAAFQQDMIEKDSNIVSVNLMKDQVKDIDKVIRALKLIVLVIIVCAAVLAFVVLYNLTNTNITERTREIATVKVLGFSKKEVDRYVFGENIILCVIGILLGCIGGYYLGMFIIETVEVDMVAFTRDIQWTSYLISGGLTLCFTLLINKIMSKKVKNIDMVESLKAIE